MPDFNPDFLFFADLHLDERREFSRVTPTGLNSRLEEGLDVLDQIIKVAFENKVKAVIIGGDIWEHKDRRPDYMLVEFSNRIKLLATGGIDIYILKGNHDAKLPSYSVLSTMESINFIDSPAFLTIHNLGIGFIPFVRDRQQFKTIWNEFHEKMSPFDPKVIFFHNDLPGAYYSAFKVVEGNSREYSIFPNALYMGGHLHLCQAMTFNGADVIYMGTPYQQDFSDEGTNKYVFLFDSAQRKIKKVQLKYPHFKTVELQEEINPDGVFNSYIRIVGEHPVHMRPAVKAFKETLMGLGAKGVSIQIKFRMERQKRLKADKKEHHQVLQEYLQTANAQSLNKEKLLSIGIAILEG